MLNILVCDDEKGTCEELKEILRKHAYKNKIMYHIETFYTGASLSNYLMTGHRADILFLDISLPGIDGINIGNNQKYHWR